jgi:HSP20 family protein
MSKLTVTKVRDEADRTLPVFAEFDEIMDRVRNRAYDFFCERGRSDGNALDDWLAAEREIGYPEAELAEQDSEYALNVALPGFDSDEISVTATPRELIIKAAHLTRHEDQSGEPERRVHWSELRQRNVMRRVRLPSEIDVSKTSAELDQGVLKIEAPKAGENEGRAKPAAGKQATARRR